jgi:hypothetical protein
MSVSKQQLSFYAFTVVAVSAAALAGACSSSGSGTSGGTTTDSGTDSQGSSGTSGADTGTIGAQDTDTCKGAAVCNSCQCACEVTGQTENTALHCIQPNQGTGECPKVCCSGPIEAGSSSGTPITDAGSDG